MLDTVKRAGRKVAEAVGLVDSDLANRREQLRAILADRPNRVAAMKSASVKIEDLKRQEYAGEIPPAAVRRAEEEYHSKSVAVAACDAAERELRDSAPHALRFEHRQIARRHAGASTKIRELEDSLREHRDAAAKAADGLAALEAHGPLKHGGDMLADKLSQTAFDSQLRWAKGAVAEQNARVAQTVLEISAARKDQAAAERAYEKSVAALLAS